MTVYEVTVDVDRAIAADYLQWMHAHVAQMLALPGFDSASCYERTDADDGSRRTFVIVYRMRDQAALDAYLSDHAAAMRADAVRRFGQRFSASRRVLRALD